MSLYQILSSMGMGIFTCKNNSTTFLFRFTWAQIKTATSFSVLAEAVNKNFHPYYKIKNNIQFFSTRTKKSGHSLRLRRTSNLAQEYFSLLFLGKPAVHFFSFLQYQYFSVFHKHSAFQCFTETNGHRNNILNDICSKKNCNRAHFRLRHQRMHPAHGSITLKILRR